MTDLERDARMVAEAMLSGRDVTFIAGRVGYSRRVFARVREIVEALTGTRSDNAGGPVDGGVG